ncbi:hypothetical protein M885DRAFT_522904, partial [Pelagophyceae sp. CCMP2097]
MEHFKAHGNGEGRAYGCDARPLKPEGEEGPGKAYGQLCFYLHSAGARAACPDPPWGPAAYAAVACIEAALAAKASAAGVEPAALRIWHIDHCEDGIREWWRRVPPGAFKAVLARRGGCAGSGPRTWLAVEIREDYASLPYWILWHLSLGVEHIVVYDNDDGRLAVDAYDAALLRAALEPFLRDGVATLVPFGSRVAAQGAAYGDAVQRALAAGADFLGALDTDEFLVPFEDKCAPAWLKKCAGQEDCGAVQVNWRFSHSSVVELNHSKSLWSNLDYDVGDQNQHTKTFALAKAHVKWNLPHNNQVRPAFHHVRDDGSRLSGAASGPFALPAAYVGQRAVIYHAQRQSLLNWVKKKSMRGRVSIDIRSTSAARDKFCPTCFGSLDRIANDFPMQLPKKPANSAEKAIQAFIRDADASLEALLATWQS